MNSIINLLNIIDKVIQVGVSYSFLVGNEICWSSVGLKKWERKYMVFIDEILDSKMVSDGYLREEIISFDSIKSALKYIENHTKIKMCELAPCKS